MERFYPFANKSMMMLMMMLMRMTMLMILMMLLTLMYCQDRAFVFLSRRRWAIQGMLCTLSRSRAQACESSRALMFFG